MPIAPLTRKSPGVYVEEQPSGSVPIVGVGTSTAAFLFEASELFDHCTSRPGLDTPSLVTNFTQFREMLEDSALLYRKQLTDGIRAIAGREDSTAAKSALEASIKKFDRLWDPIFAVMYGFFLNGGTRCHVVFYKEIGTALAALAPHDDVAIIAAPGTTDKTVLDLLASHCNKTGRMAILDGPTGYADVPDFGDESLMQPAPSEYAAYYYPWIKATNPLNAGEVLVGPSAHVAGVWARVDATRGVHKAPANVDILGATDVEAVVTRNDQGGMNWRGVNAIRKLQGAIRIYGARTLAGENSEFKFINVQRTFLYIARSIDHGLRWVVFEPNTPALWGKVCRNINGFLHGLWASGALFGNTPEEAWYVRCDEVLNPPDERAKGNLKVEIGVALARPAEFVVINITQWDGPRQ